MTQDNRSTAQHLNTSWLTIIVCCLGILAGWLQIRLYQHQHPFFDSLSYYQKLARVMNRTELEGWNGGWDEVLNGHNTIALPLLMAIPVSDWIPPTRLFAVAYQSALLWLLLITWDFWLRSLTKLHRGWRLLSCLSLLALHGWYFPNGGLSDFRMDLSLMVWYAVVGILFLQSCREGSVWWALLTGLAMGLACLCRATAPVYFAVGCLPVWMCFLVTAKERWRLVRAAGWALLVAGVVCGWFFYLNGEYLRYYYVEWNSDANKKLDAWQALGHVRMCFRQWGISALIMAIAAGIIVRLDICRKTIGGLASEPESDNDTKSAERGENAVLESFPAYWILAMVWLGMAPLVFLWLWRAGLNPFVTWPASLVLFLACQLMLARAVPMMNHRGAWVLAVLVSLSVAGALGRGIVKHLAPRHGIMKFHQDVIDQILEDAQARNYPTARIATLMTTEINSPSLLSVLTYDRPQPNHRLPGGQAPVVKATVDALYFLPAEADWNSVPGTTDLDKAIHLARQAVERRIDYLLAPTPATIELMKTAVSDVVTHQHQKILLESLLDPALSSGQWTLVIDNIAGESGYRYNLYRNQTHARYAKKGVRDRF